MKKITKELIKKFRRYLIEEEKAAATVEKYIRDINVFADWLGEKDLDKETVLTYKENLIKTMLRQALIPFYHRSTVFSHSMNGITSE